MYHHTVTAQFADDRRASLMATAQRRRLLGSLRRRTPDPAPVARSTDATRRTRSTSDFDRAA
jgi:hypothetical protein